MITKIELDDGFLPRTVSDHVKRMVVNSLNNIATQGDKFIVNDTVFMRKQTSKKFTPCVMNSANFISSNFQKNLSLLPDCFGETNFLNQSFDGLIKIDYKGVAYRLKDKNNIIEIIDKYIKKNNLPKSAIYNLFPMFFGMYVDRFCFNITPINELKHFFDETNIEHSYNIGVEFETGNVASSFRAINKMNNLFHNGLIDGGCFITSTDKPNGATRIWPVSNRNGSFQELKNRLYSSQISSPLICIGFLPDAFSKHAKFLATDGSLYDLIDTGVIDKDTGMMIHANNNGDEFLKSI